MNTDVLLTKRFEIRPEKLKQTQETSGGKQHNDFTAFECCCKIHHQSDHQADHNVVDQTVSPQGPFSSSECRQYENIWVRNGPGRKETLDLNLNDALHFSFLQKLLL